MIKSIIHTCSLLFFTIVIASCAPDIKPTLQISEIPNSAIIFFQALDSEDLYRINSDGTGMKLVCKDSSNIIISPNRKNLIIRSGKRVNGLWEANKFIYIYKEGSLFTVDEVANDYLVNVTWAPDSDLLLFINAKQGNMLQLYDVNERRVINSYLVDKPQEYPIYDFRFSKDGKYFLTTEPSGDCSIHCGHIYKQYSIASNTATLTPFTTVSEKDFKNRCFTSFEEVWFHVYSYEKKFTPSKTKYLELKDGDIINQDGVIYDYTGPYCPDFGFHGVSLADWISEGHIVFEYEAKIYVLDTATQKIAFLVKGAHPVVFLR